MKWKLYILLFGLIVFLGETFTLPVIGDGNSTKKVCAMHMKMKVPPKKDCCSHKSKPAMNCIDCPLCYLTVSTPFTKYFLFIENRKIEYSDFLSCAVSGFSNENWKPPDSGNFYQEFYI